jgi:hypothetical protein
MVRLNFRDITSKLSALQQTVDVVDSPADLDEGAKEDVKQNVKAILEEAVGTGKQNYISIIFFSI